MYNTGIPLGAPQIREDNSLGAQSPFRVPGMGNMMPGNPLAGGQNPLAVPGMQPPMQPPMQTLQGAPQGMQAPMQTPDLLALLAMLGNQPAPGILSAPPAQMPMRDNLFQRYGIPAASPAQLYG
jgi:hypothetical protein